MERANHKTLLGVSFLASLAIWMIFSWPLPLEMTSGIPATYVAESPPTRNMIPGDHLQLLYHFWLAGDMIRGNTPLFYDLYEFNQGDDEKRYSPSTLYLPFSAVYVIGDFFGGRAFGWNVTGLVSLWLTFHLCWLLLLRYDDSLLSCGFLAAISIIFPYRWVTMLGGSPTGFAMTLAPMLFLGLDIAVRDSRTRGGILAGLAILFASCSDTHVFFFGTLSVPFYCVLALANRPDWHIWKKHNIRQLSIALWPVPVFLAGAFVMNKLITAHIEGSHIKERAIKEVIGFTPGWHGLFSYNNYVHPDNHIYFGYVLIALLLIGLLAFIGKRKKVLADWTLPLLLLGIAAIVIAALGPKDPLFDGKVFIGMRKFIPPFRMVRQTDKIFAFLPVLLAMAALFSARFLAAIQTKSKISFSLMAGVLVSLMLIEYASQYGPTISKVDKENNAYAAIRADADQHNRDPHMLALVMWPGDSHFASIYMHYASLYRIKLVNGYAPFPDASFKKTIVPRFSSLNNGHITNEQLDELLAKGVEYIVFHENMFPEKVGPYPATFTLNRLLANGRIALLKQDGPAWAFKILPELKQDAIVTTGWNLFMAAGQWEAEYSSEKILCQHIPAKDDPGSETTGGDGFIRMKEPGGRIHFVPAYMGSVSNQHFLVRTRGQGKLSAKVLQDEHGETSLATLAVNSPNWVWQKLPVETLPAYGKTWLFLDHTEGLVDIDSMTLVAGHWPQLAPGETLTLPAALFFHAGNIDLKTNDVKFYPDRDWHGVVLYGPKLPFEKGVYEFEVIFSAPEKSPRDQALGHWDVRRLGPTEGQRVDIMNGQPSTCIYDHDSSLPLNLVLIYNRVSNLSIHAIQVTRIQ